MKCSVEDAEACGARLRTVQIAEDVPIILDAYQAKVRAQNSRLRNGLIALALLLTAVTVLFGLQDKSQDWNRKDVDWDHLDGQLISKKIIITQSSINGRKLGSLRLHNRYKLNVSRVGRMGLNLLATPNLVLQYGDRLTVVGRAEDIAKAEAELGNANQSLKDPNLASIFVGITLGLMLGSIPIFVPGVNLPVRLGLAGGPIIAGILMGAYGSRLHLRTYTTRSANLMLRGVGLSLYLACLGLDSGPDFISTMPGHHLWNTLWQHGEPDGSHLCQRQCRG